MKLTLNQQDLISRYLGGESPKEIAIGNGIGANTIHHTLALPHVRSEIERRLATVAERVMKFKLDAFDGAEGALQKLVNLSQFGKTEELQRLSSLDVVKIAGLMPRKRVLVESNNQNGIDEDTREWFSQVLQEARGEIIESI